MSSQLEEMHHYTVCTILCLKERESSAKQYCTMINKIKVLYTLCFISLFKEQTELECKTTQRTIYVALTSGVLAKQRL